MMRAIVLALVGMAFSAAAWAQKADQLTPLMQCSARTKANCGDLDTPVWRRFESDVGEVTKINVESIQRADRGVVSVTVYSYVPGTRFRMDNLRRLSFDCHGSMSDMRSPAAVLDVPPRSVAGRIAAYVCSYHGRVDRPAPAMQPTAQASKVMRAWNAANEGCQGGHVTWDSPICKRRDALQAEARRLGWCWSYSDWRVYRADYQWHRCNVAHPTGFKSDF